jgi:hypothetical protein
MDKQKNSKKLPKKILLIHPDLDKLSELTDKFIDTIIPKNQRSLFVMELNFENCVKLLDLRISVNDFIKTRSIFSTHPKILLLRNIDLTNQTIRHLYSKVIAMKHNVIMITSALNIANVPKQVITQSNVYWYKNNIKPITSDLFYKWMNSQYQYNRNVSKKSAVFYLNNEFLSQNPENLSKNIEHINLFNKIVETNTTNFHDECIKLILKTSKPISQN